MADVIFLAVTVAFFAAAVLLVKACDRIVGRGTSPAVHTPGTVEAEAA